MVLLIGPLIAVIGILVAVYVLRGKAVQKRSLYSSQRDRLAHKVQVARDRTLAPVARAEKEAEKQAEKKAAKSGHAAPPPAETAKARWEQSPTAPAHGGPAAPSSTSAGEPAWTPTAAPTPLPPPPPPPPEPPAQPVSEPSAAPWHPSSPETEPEAPAAASPTGWAVVGGGGKETPMTAAPSAAGKASWEVVGQTVEPEKLPEEKKPSAAVGLVQYAVLVVGLVMILIGCLVMIANVHGG